MFAINRFDFSIFIGCLLHTAFMTEPAAARNLHASGQVKRRNSRCETRLPSLNRKRMLSASPTVAGGEVTRWADAGPVQ